MKIHHRRFRTGAFALLGFLCLGTLSALDDAQKKKILGILAMYPNPAALDDADIVHIREAIREARVPGGPELDAVIDGAGFDSKALRPVKGEGGEGKGKGKGRNKGNGPQFTIEQATSDNAQLNTLAYDGMAWLSGSFNADTFLPPGKVSDFFGFQYLRDNDAAGMGHNTSFLTRIANNMLNLLNAEQKSKLKSLGAEQAPAIREYAIRRFTLMKAFRRLLENDLPAGRTRLDPEAVQKFSADLYELDANLFLRRAEVMAMVLQSLDGDQRFKLETLVKGNFKTWPDAPETDDKRSISHDAHVALMTYVSELFSWAAGNVESDTYFCPEGIAKYFGAFYVKDAPAVRNPDYSIGSELTGDGGKDFLKTLDDEQRAHVTSLVEKQRSSLGEIVTTRRAIATELRKLIVGETIDRDLIRKASRRYGELDGLISTHYATGYAAAARTLTAAQKAALVKIRALDPKYTPDKPFAYADPIDMPKIESTDGFFRK